MHRRLAGLPSPLARNWIFAAPSATRTLVVLILAVGASGCAEKVRPVLLPTASEPVQRAFARMRPSLIWNDIKVDHEEVRAVLCPAGQPKSSCFSLRLVDPGSRCAGRDAGAFCVLTDSDRSASEMNIIESSLRGMDSREIWTVIPGERPNSFRRAREFGPMIVLSVMLLAAALLAIRNRRGLVELAWSLAVWVRRIPAESRRAVAGGWPGIVVGLAVSGLVFLRLHRFSFDPPTLGADGSVWFSLARDCVELGKCSASGARSSIGFDTGAIWTDFIIVTVELAHGTSLGARTANVALLSAGIGTLFVVLWRWLRLPVAVSVAFGALTMLSRNADVGWLWNPSLAFFPDALYFASILVFAWTGRPGFLGFASLFLALAVNTHLAAGALFPSLLAVALLVGAQPIRSVCVAAGVFVATGLLVAPGSTVVNVAGALERANPAILAGVALGIGWGVLRLRPWFQRLGPDGTAAAVACAALLPWVAGRYTIASLVESNLGPSLTGWLAASYGCPIVAPTVLLIVLIAMRLADFASVAARPVACGILLLWFARMAPAGILPAIARDVWTHEDVRVIEQYLEARGWDVDRALNRLQTPTCWNLYGGMLAYTRRPPPGNPDPPRQLRLWLVDGDATVVRAPGFDVIPLRHGRAAVVSEIESWLDVDGAEYCQSGDSRCVRAADVAARSPAPEFLFSRMTGPWYPPGSHDPKRDESIVIPLSTTGEVRSVSVFGSAYCPWTIENVEGLEFSRGQTQDSVRISGRAGAEGKLVIGRKRETCSQWDPRPPCFLESRPDDPSILSKAAGAQ